MWVGLELGQKSGAVNQRMATSIARRLLRQLKMCKLSRCRAERGAVITPASNYI
jgi:hypothetical protein